MKETRGTYVKLLTGRESVSGTRGVSSKVGWKEERLRRLYDRYEYLMRAYRLADEWYKDYWLERIQRVRLVFPAELDVLYGGKR